MFDPLTDFYRAVAGEADRLREETYAAREERAAEYEAAAAARRNSAEAIAAEWDAMDAPYRDGWNF